MVVARGIGVGGEVEVSKGGEMGVEGSFAWDNGHTVRCVDGVLLSCALDTCMVL